MINQVRKLLDDLKTTRKEKSCGDRFDSFQKLLEIAEVKPEEVYPFWDEICLKLDSQNSFHKYHAVLLLTRLVKADKQRKIDKIIDKITNLLKDRSFVVAINTANNLGKIVRERRDFDDKITDALIGLNKTEHKHKDLLKSGAVLSFKEYYKVSRNQDKIRKFVENLAVSSSSPKAKRMAKEFLKNYT